MYQTCDPAVPDVVGAATVNDFIVAYTLTTAVELSNLDTEGSTIDCDRINMALVDAYNLLMSYKLLVNEISQQVIDLNLRRWMLILARYYLDTYKKQRDVVDEFEKLVKFLDDLAAGDAKGNYKMWNHNGRQAVWTSDSLSYLNRKDFGVY